MVESHFRSTGSRDRIHSLNDLSGSNVVGVTTYSVKGATFLRHDPLVPSTIDLEAGLAHTEIVVESRA